MSSQRQPEDNEHDEYDEAGENDQSQNSLGHFDLLGYLQSRGYHNVMTSRGLTIHPLSLPSQHNANDPTARAPAANSCQTSASVVANSPTNRLSSPGSSVNPSHDPSSTSDYHVSRSQASPVEDPEISMNDRDDEPSEPNSPSHSSKTEDAPSPRSARRASFIPPGQDSPRYVPFGIRGIATEQQGNREGIDKSLRGLIVDEELDNQRKRPAAQRLTYAQIAAKYPAWNVSSGGLRWHNRRYFTNPEGSLERVPTFGVHHLNALREAVPKAADRRGRVSWRVVREDVMRRTGKQFGMPALRKRWDALRADGLHEKGDLKAVADVEEEVWVEAPDDEPGVEHGTKRSRKDEDEDDEGGMGGGAAQFAPGRPERARSIRA